MIIAFISCFISVTDVVICLVGRRRLFRTFDRASVLLCLPRRKKNKAQNILACFDVGKMDNQDKQLKKALPEIRRLFSPARAASLTVLPALSGRTVFFALEIVGNKR